MENTFSPTPPGIVQTTLLYNLKKSIDYMHGIKDPFNINSRCNL